MCQRQRKVKANNVQSRKQENTRKQLREGKGKEGGRGCYGAGLLRRKTFLTPFCDALLDGWKAGGGRAEVNGARAGGQRGKRGGQCKEKKKKKKSRRRRSQRNSCKNEMLLIQRDAFESNENGKRNSRALLPSHTTPTSAHSSWR